MSGSQRAGASARAPIAQGLCGLLGVVYLVVGVLGLLQTGAGEFDGHVHGTVGGLGGTTLLNLVHTILGALLLLLAASRASGARVGGLFGVLAFLGLTAYGVVAALRGGEDEPLGVDWPATVLHGVSVLIAAAMVVFATRATADGARWRDRLRRERGAKA
ncbi:DUF4383 domain-containing protein [Actinokineospora iranica]|uniref:DUF4383 domain-containing protein n=1 Tax=Actinokineospora iranica TaxID=1271860 RepID=A0A1G6XG62_9PSEU|nr:DUF4383 domain-containing protein [Actinokineospora iranica]SDD76315.1 protein of unknown function [Actinokineospora iranica]